ncbi:MAG: hypothetical protein N2D54_04770 [Chloroflexota bacterium]
MNRLERVIFIGLIFGLFFSAGDLDHAAVAAPQKAVTIKYITIPVSAFEANNATISYDNFGSTLSTSIAGGIFEAWVPLPRGARVKNIELVVKDNHFSKNSCARAYITKPTTGVLNYLDEACSKGQSPTIRQFKTGFPKRAVFQKNAFFIELHINNSDITVYAVRVGYLP